MPRPLNGVCAAVERATFGVWTDEPATLLPLSYARAIQRAGGRMAMLPPDPRATDAPPELLDRIDALVLGGGAARVAARGGRGREGVRGGPAPGRCGGGVLPPRGPLSPPWGGAGGAAPAPPGEPLALLRRRHHQRPQPRRRYADRRRILAEQP